MNKLIILPVLFLFLSCSMNDSGLLHPGLLINGIESFSPINKVEVLKNASSMEVLEDTKLPEGDKRPPFSIYSVSIPYRHFDVAGNLHLSFLNNRLMNTWFYPSDQKADLNALKNNDIDLIIDNERKISKYVRVWKYKNFNNKLYVAWEDIRLRKELNDWIRSYS